MTYLFTFLSIVFWASSFVGIRYALKDYPPIELAVLRFAVASVILIIIAFVKKIRIPDKRDIIHIVFMGVLFFLNLIFLNYGALTVKAGEISFILGTSNLFTAFMAYLFLKESISVKLIVGLIISFFGIGLISLNTSSGFSFNTGIIFIILASFSYSSFFIVQKPLLKKYSSLEVTSYAIWISTIFMLPFGIDVFGRIPDVSISSTIAVTYIGIFPTIVAFLCWSLVLSKIEVSKASAFLYLIPVVTVIIGYIWLREIPSLISLLGGLIAIAGVIIANGRSMIKKAQ